MLGGYIFSLVMPYMVGYTDDLDADAESLTAAYGHFKTEANNVSQDYEPKTVTTDGWTATKLAWQYLFPMITVILCFLHSFINIRDRCKRMKGTMRKSKPGSGKSTTQLITQPLN